VSESRAVFFGETFGEFKNLIDTDCIFDEGHTLRWGSPCSKHDLLSNGNLFGTGENRTNDYVGSDNQEEVEDEDLLGEDGIKSASGIECELEQVHLKVLIKYTIVRRL
jgi:hypothetical protein